MKPILDPRLGRLRQFDPDAEFVLSKLEDMALTWDFDGEMHGRLGKDDAKALLEAIVRIAVSRCKEELADDHQAP